MSVHLLQTSPQLSTIPQLAQYTGPPRYACCLTDTGTDAASCKISPFIHDFTCLTVIDNWKILFLATFEAASVFGLLKSQWKEIQILPHH